MGAVLAAIGAHLAVAGIAILEFFGIAVTPSVGFGVWAAAVAPIAVAMPAALKRGLDTLDPNGPLCVFSEGIEAAWETQTRLSPAELSKIDQRAEPHPLSKLQENLDQLGLDPGLHLLAKNGMATFAYQPLRDIPPAMQSKVQLDLFQAFDFRAAAAMEKTLHDLNYRYLEYCGTKGPGEASHEDEEMVALKEEAGTAMKGVWDKIPEHLKDHLFGQERKLMMTML